MSSLLSDPTFIALNRLTTRPYRNAEVVTIPAGIHSVARACDTFRCGPHNLLYEVDCENGSEWVDFSREVAATFRGEVIFASHYALSVAFSCPLLAERPANGPKRVFDNPSKPPCNNFPAIFLDPARWSGVPQRRSSPQRRDRTNDDDAAAEKKQDGEKEVEDDVEEEANRGPDLDFRVFVSFHPESITRRRARVGQRCLLVRHDDPVEEANRSKSNTAAAASACASQLEDDRTMKVTATAAPPARKSDDDAAADAVVAGIKTSKTDGDENQQETQQQERQQNQVTSPKPARAATRPRTTQAARNAQKLNDSLRALELASRGVPIEAFSNDYKSHVFGQQPLSGAQTVFVGSVVWNRIAQHLYATTVNSVASRAVTDLRRSEPQRRMIAFCGYGMPEETVFRAILRKLAPVVVVDNKETKSNQQSLLRKQDFNLVLFLEVPTLHYDPARGEIKSASSQQGGAATKSTATRKQDHPHQQQQQQQLPLLARAQQQRPRRSHFKLAKLHAMLTRVMESAASEYGSVVTEVDVVINAASRYVSSPHRIPSQSLFQVYVKEMRGGVDVLASASSVSCLNHTDRMSPIMVEAFAQRQSVPFVRLEQFLGAELFVELPARPEESAFDDDQFSSDDGSRFSDDDDDDDAAVGKQLMVAEIAGDSQQQDGGEENHVIKNDDDDDDDDDIYNDFYNDDENEMSS